MTFIENKRALIYGQNKDFFVHIKTKRIYHYFPLAKQILMVGSEQKETNTEIGLARNFKYFYVRDSESKNSEKN